MKQTDKQKERKQNLIFLCVMWMLIESIRKWKQFKMEWVGSRNFDFDITHNQKNSIFSNAMRFSRSLSLHFQTTSKLQRNSMSSTIQYQVFVPLVLYLLLVEVSVYSGKFISPSSFLTRNKLNTAWHGVAVATDCGRSIKVHVERKENAAKQISGCRKNNNVVKSKSKYFCWIEQFYVWN